MRLNATTGEWFDVREDLRLYHPEIVPVLSKGEAAIAIATSTPITKRRMA